MEKLRQTRRRFIASLITFPLFLAAFWRFLVPKEVKKAALLRVPVKDIPANGALVFRDSRIAIIHDERGISAVSLVCTHLGCTVAVTPTGMVCPCHGSRFDLKGEVLSGPADRALMRLVVETNGDQLTVKS